MKFSNALIFGQNRYAIEIAKNLKENYADILFFIKDDTKISKELENYKVLKFDLSDDWSDFEIDRFDIDINSSIVFCVLDDEAENIFLTISIRSHFKDIPIISVSKNQESVYKLKMAGANKVIPIVETTADMISSLVENPISSKVLESFLYDESNLKVVQIEVENAEIFDGKFPADIDWSRYRGIIVLAVMHKDLSSEFIYSSKAKHKTLKNGDMLVVVGYEDDIKEFEKTVGRRTYVDWSYWSR